MSSFLLKDGRTVDKELIVDFDATHTNCINKLTTDEYETFVQVKLPDPPPAPPPPVTQVTPRQARLALNAAGLLDKVEQAVAASDRSVQISWDFATEINRDDPIIAAMKSALGLSDDTLDEMFNSAVNL